MVNLQQSFPGGVRLGDLKPSTLPPTPGGVAYGIGILRCSLTGEEGRPRPVVTPEELSMVSPHQSFPEGVQLGEPKPSTIPPTPGGVAGLKKVDYLRALSPSIINS